MKIKVSAASIALLVCSNLSYSAFFEKKDNVRVTVYDLSIQNDRKIGGNSSCGARKITELNRLGIFPLLIQVDNKNDHTYLLSSQKISVPTLSIGELSLKFPVDKLEDFWIVLGMIAVGCALALPPAIDGKLDWTGNMISKKYRVPVSLVASGTFLYLMIRGFKHLITATQNRKKDQISWMNEYLLSSFGIEINPSTSRQRYIFLDKVSYEKGEFTLALQKDNGEELSFQVNILP